METLSKARILSSCRYQLVIGYNNLQKQRAMKNLFKNRNSIGAKRILAISCIGAIVCLFTSCDKYRHMMWDLYIECDDSITVEYPISDPSEEYSTKNILEKVEIFGDTLIDGSLLMHGYDYKDINLYITRKTHNHDVRVLFVDRAAISHAPLYIHDDFGYSYNKQVLDSLMNIYGVTIPAETDLMTIPITGLPYGK